MTTKQWPITFAPKAINLGAHSLSVHTMRTSRPVPLLSAHWIEGVVGDAPSVRRILALWTRFHAPIIHYPAGTGHLGREKHNLPHHIPGQYRIQHHATSH